MPPVNDSMLLDRSRLVSWTLFSVVNCTEPLVPFTGMVMLWPLARLITSGAPLTGSLKVTV
ncbi:hypothetical protein D3C81_2067210 [compost metagenome]